MRMASAILSSCAFLALTLFVSPAKAGDYYGGGYYGVRHSSGNVWYSSDCCYKKVVRHVRTVRYVRTEPYRHHGYYEPRPRYGYYEPPRYRESYYVPPREYYGRPAYSTVYVEPPRPRYYSTYAPW